MLFENTFSTNHHQDQEWGTASPSMLFTRTGSQTCERSGGWLVDLASRHYLSSDLSAFSFNLVLQAFKASAKLPSFGGYS